MNTMTDEIDVAGRSNRMRTKWYSVRPTLLAILLAELAIFGGLLVTQSAGMLYLLAQVPAVQIGFREVELTLMTLAALAVSAVFIRARREDPRVLKRLFRRSKREHLVQSSVTVTG